MAGGEDHVIAGDDVQDVEDFLLELAVFVQAVLGRGLDALLLHLKDDACPEGQLLVGVAVELVGRLMFVITGGEPHELNAAACRHLHRRGVETADRAVEGDGADGVAAGIEAVDELGSARGGSPVVLDRVAGKGRSRDALCHVDVVHFAGQAVGRGVYVQVIPAFEKFLYVAHDDSPSILHSSLLLYIVEQSCFLIGLYKMLFLLSTGNLTFFQFWLECIFSLSFFVQKTQESLSIISVYR